MMEIKIVKYEGNIAKLNYAKHVLWLPFFGSLFATFALVGMVLSFCNPPYRLELLSICFIPAFLLGRNMLLVDSRIYAHRLAKYLAYYSLGVGILGFVCIIEELGMLIKQVVIIFNHLS